MKQNLILKAAVAAAFGVFAAASFAGNMATTTFTFATENFGATQASTVAITPAAVSYSVSSAGGVTVAVGQTVTLYLRLNAGHVFAAAPAAATFTGTVQTALGVPTAVAIGAGANANTIAVTFTNANAAAVNLPINSSIIWTPAAGAVTATSATLAVAGGTISVTGSLSGLAVNTAAATTPADQDPVSAPVNIAVSAQAISGAVVSSAAFSGAAGVAEQKRIDLAAASGPATAFAGVSNTAAANIVNLGAYTFTNNAAVTPVTLGGAPYALAAANAAAGAMFAGSTATIAPGAGQSFPVGARFAIYTDAACTTLASALSPALTAAQVQTSVAVPATTGNAVPGTAVRQYVCMTVPGAAPFSTMTAVTPTIAVALNKTVATDAPNNIVATNAYPLTLNGSSATVKSYVPAAAPGYTSFVRVINNGVVAAPVSAAVIADGGTTGTSAVIIPSLAAGASATLSSTQIEAATGAIAATSRPRLLITAPTNGMTVQSFLLTNANGNYATVHGND